MCSFFLHAQLSNFHPRNSTSRRGSPTSSDMDLIFFHPDHVHVPMPPLPKAASSPESRKSNAFRGKYVPVNDLDNSILLQDVVRPLGAAGFIADTLSSGARMWKGIVRLPVRRSGGRWEESWERKRQIEKVQGSFRRVDMTFVSPC